MLPSTTPQQHWPTDHQHAAAAPHARRMDEQLLCGAFSADRSCMRPAQAVSVKCMVCAELCCCLTCCRIFKIKDPKFAGIAPKECKPMVVPDEEH